MQKYGVDDKDSLQGISPCDTSISLTEIVLVCEAVLVMLSAVLVHKLDCIRSGAKVELKP